MIVFYFKCCSFIIVHSSSTKKYNECQNNLNGLDTPRIHTRNGNENKNTWNVYGTNEDFGHCKVLYINNKKNFLFALTSRPSPSWAMRSAQVTRLSKTNAYTVTVSFHSIALHLAASCACGVWEIFSRPPSVRFKWFS